MNVIRNINTMANSMYNSNIINNNNNNNVNVNANNKVYNNSKVTKDLSNSLQVRDIKTNEEYINEYIYETSRT